MRNYDVAIIGAGVTGCAVARHLSRFRLKIALIDAAEDVAMGASRANSAIVHALSLIHILIVRAQLEAKDLVHLVALGGEHDDGDVRSRRRALEPPAHFHAINAGEHDIQQDVYKRQRRLLPPEPRARQPARELLLSSLPRRARRCWGRIPPCSRPARR